MQKLQSDVGRVDAAGGKYGEARTERVGDGGHVAQRRRTDRAARHASVRRAALHADARPRDGRTVEARLDRHQTGHGVGRRHAVRLACMPRQQHASELENKLPSIEVRPTALAFNFLWFF